MKKFAGYLGLANEVTRRFMEMVYGIFSGLSRTFFLGVSVQKPCG